MTLINFSNFDDGRFHRLCNDLVIAEYPAAKCIEGSGRDRGIDCYLGVLTAEHFRISAQISSSNSKEKWQKADRRIIKYSFAIC